MKSQSVTTADQWEEKKKKKVWKTTQGRRSCSPSRQKESVVAKELLGVPP